MSAFFEDLDRVVRAIPPGRCASYGQVGAQFETPVSGLVVGRALARVPGGESDLPWWRVVARDGSMPIGKRDPALSFKQASLLLAEGVPVEDGKVSRRAFLPDDWLAG